MLQAVILIFKADDPSHRPSTMQYLKKSDLSDFLSILYDTTIARSSSGQHEQLLDVFYGTLMLCMIRFLLFLAFRYSTYDYEPLNHQANHDPTFLNGPNSQLYQPMLILLKSSMSTLQGGNAHFRRAAAAVNSSTFRPSATPPPTSMYDHALCFISHFSRECYKSQFDPHRP